MLDKFWESLGEDLAKRWVEHLFGPAGLFWLGGALLALIQGRAQSWVESFLNLSTWLQGAVALLAIAGVVGSAQVVRLFVFPLLRLLEGYWGKPLSELSQLLTARLATRLEKCRERARALKKKEQEEKNLSWQETQELIDLETWLHQYPVQRNNLLPTLLGNLLRARELAPLTRYGLDALVCWARLWGLLPPDLREDLLSARAALNRRVEAFAWGLLFLLWGWVSSWWAIPVGLVWMAIAYYQACLAAVPYGDLIETAFDLYRFRLYDALGWARPAESASEKAHGEALNEFLWRGVLKEPIRYPDKPGDE